LNFVTETDADSMAEMPDSRPEGSGRKPREYGQGASNGTAKREPVRPEESPLMEAVVARENLLKAYVQVMSNKGAAGIDEMPVEQLKPYLQAHWAQIKESLLNGTYQPQAVRCVEIPKPNGGVRQLGIPTVLDRLIQQALQQVLSPLFEPNFSESSYGFRPGRSAHDAVKQARAYVAEGRRSRCRPGFREIFRPGQSRRANGAAGPTDQRQTHAALDSQLPASGADGKRRRKPTSGGNSTRGPTLAVALERPTG
jgi:hypothetical protein